MSASRPDDRDPQAARLHALSNALRFTPSGGVVTVRLRPQTDEVILHVTDTGPGITADELP